MATGEIPAPGVFHGDKAKDGKTFRQWKKKCQRWFQAKEISSEKKRVQWIECLLEGNADDVYEMIPVDETKGHRRLDAIWKSLEERFDVPESVLEHLHKFQQFKRKDSQSINEYFVQLVAKANKAFPGASAEEIGRHVVDTFALNVSDAKLTAKVIAHRDTLTLERLGKLVLEKEQARSLAKTIGVDIQTEATEGLNVEPKCVEVKQEAQVAALYERVANLEREMGAVRNENKVSLEERIARLEASQGKTPLAQGRAARSVECRNCHKLGHIMRECPDITCFGCGRRGHMQGSSKCQRGNRGNRVGK